MKYNILRFIWCNIYSFCPHILLKLAPSGGVLRYVVFHDVSMDRTLTYLQKTNLKTWTSPQFQYARNKSTFVIVTALFKEADDSAQLARDQILS